MAPDFRSGALAPDFRSGAGLEGVRRKHMFDRSASGLQQLWWPSRVVDVVAVAVAVVVVLLVGGSRRSIRCSRRSRRSCVERFVFVVVVVVGSNS